eukprot:15477592-Alexandrium_andersonii.AAC.1
MARWSLKRLPAAWAAWRSSAAFAKMALVLSQCMIGETWASRAFSRAWAYGSAPQRGAGRRRPARSPSGV